MELQKQVTSLEISKRLKELGVKQGSLFWYGRADENGELTLSGIPSRLNGNWVGEFSAFTVAELGEMLPANVQLPSKRPVMNTGKEWSESWFWSNEGGRHKVDTEADARGKMLIYLLENNLITLI